MLKRLKRMWELSAKDSIILDALTDEQIAEIPDEGDGKAEFFGEGTEEELEEQNRADKGLDKWYKVLGL